VNRTAAKELARLKVHYAEWTIRPVGTEHGGGYTAQQWGTGKAGKPPLRIHALNVTELATRLAEVEEGRGPGPGNI
jgi:hypothetical protein